MKKKAVVAVAMSGGVDSSVAASLLIEQDYEVLGFTMALWNCGGAAGPQPAATACCSLESIEDARSVCQTLGIPHYVLNLRDKFRQHIIQNFIAEYLAGRTPNPCIRCNRLMKWGELLHQAQQAGADKLATGHYARCHFDTPRQRFVLLKGCDVRKDQAYALWDLTQAQLARTILPLGELTKTEVRQRAQALGLKTAAKVESQEICFIPDDNYERFLKAEVPQLKDTLQSGEVIDEHGQVLGFHRGYPFYTIGQRKGLGVAAGHRIYVNRIEPATNRIYVGQKERIFARGLIARQVNWVSDSGEFAEKIVMAKIRYKDPGFQASLIPRGEAEVELRFVTPQKSVTPGQSAVFYDGDYVLGGGVIASGIEAGEATPP